MLAEPARTPYDWRFSIFGFDVRVSAWFWLAALIISAPLNAGGIQALLAGMAAMFVSILIHELGHTFAFRRFGQSSHIVLYHFGGLAIPTSRSSPWGANTTRIDPQAQIMISAAGPAAQFFSAILLIFLVNAVGYAVPMMDLVARFTPEQTGNVIDSIAARSFLMFYSYISVWWALLNLLPVFPLDGGQIARNLLYLFAHPSVAVPYSLMLSVAAAAAAAFWGFSRGDHFLLIMFGLLGYSSYQQLQMYQGPGRWR